MSKIFILIITLVAIGATAFLANYTRYPLSEIQSIKLPAGEKLETAEAVETPHQNPEREQVPYRAGKFGAGQVEKIKEEIKTEVEGEIIKYQQTSFYSEGDFVVILGNHEEFKNQLIERFKKKTIGVTAENCKVDLNGSKKSAALKCDVKGAKYSANSYNMHFLLGNWPFDLYQFKKYEKKLVYEGKIGGVPTNIVFEFPYIFSHCHEHVWPK